MKIQAVYSDDSVAFAEADARVEGWYENVRENVQVWGNRVQPYQVFVATGLMFDRLRLARAMGEIDSLELRLPNGDIITTDEDGRLETWPKGIFDQWEDILYSLLGANADRRDAEK